MSDTVFQVGRLGRMVYVSVTGQANLKVTPVLDAFLRSETDAGQRAICIDLGACTGMDSTFMGCLVGQSTVLKETGGQLVVVNPSTAMLRLLDMLGVSKVLPVLPDHPLEAQPELHPLESGPGQSTLERMTVIKEAHQHLIAISAENEAQFAPFLDALERDLERLAGRDSRQE